VAALLTRGPIDRTESVPSARTGGFGGSFLSTVTGRRGRRQAASVCGGMMSR
jgi:hypothetical protein